MRRIVELPASISKRGGGCLMTIRLVGVSAIAARPRKYASRSASVEFAGGSGAWTK